MARGRKKLSPYAKYKNDFNNSQNIIDTLLYLYTW